MNKTTFALIVITLGIISSIHFSGCSARNLPQIPANTATSLNTTVLTPTATVTATAASTAANTFTNTPTITSTSTATSTMTPLSMAFQGGADSVISSGANAQLNTGACSNLLIGTSAGVIYRTLLDFDTSAIPVSASVTAAVLYIRLPVYNSMWISVFNITKFWTEGTGDCAGTAGSYSSWDFADGSSNPWTTAGGDYDPGSAITLAPAGGALNIALSAAMVQAWVENPSQNFGMLVKSNELANTSQITDGTGGADAPKLTVYYY